MRTLAWIIIAASFAWMVFAFIYDTLMEKVKINDDDDFWDCHD